MIHPSDPKRVRFQMNVPELLGEEACISGFDVKNNQTPFILRQTNMFPSHQSRFISLQILDPQEIAAQANNPANNQSWDQKNADPKLNHTLQNRSN